MGTPTRLTVIAATALLGACATYKQKSVWNNGGYSESKRAPGVYQVWFVGDEYTTGERSEDLALLRAAELCLGESKPFMLASGFKSEILGTRNAYRLETTHTYRYGEVTGERYVPTMTTGLRRVPGATVFTTRSGLMVTCLPEKSDDAQEAAIVAASIRERYAIAK